MKESNSETTVVCVGFEVNSQQEARDVKILREETKHRGRQAPSTCAWLKGKASDR